MPEEVGLDLVSTCTFLQDRDVNTKDRIDKEINVLVITDKVNHYLP
jgi:hypothetical protein